MPPVAAPPSPSPVASPKAAVAGVKSGVETAAVSRPVSSFVSAEKAENAEENKGSAVCFTGQESSVSSPKAVAQTPAPDDEKRAYWDAVFADALAGGADAAVLARWRPQMEAISRQKQSL